MAKKWPKMAQKLTPAGKNSIDISAASSAFCISVLLSFCLRLWWVHSGLVQPRPQPDDQHCSSSKRRRADGAMPGSVLQASGLCLLVHSLPSPCHWTLQLYFLRVFLPSLLSDSWRWPRHRYWGDSQRGGNFQTKFGVHGKEVHCCIIFFLRSGCEK